MFDWARLGVALLLIALLVYGLVLVQSATELPIQEVVGKESSRRWCTALLFVCFGSPALRLVVGAVAREPVVLLDRRGASVPALVPGQRWVILPIGAMTISMGGGRRPPLIFSGGERTVTLHRYRALRVGSTSGPR